MTKEEKQLLLIILCEMMPYGVKGIITYDESNTIFTVEGIDNNVLHLSDAEACNVEDFKPYLRQMDSMSEEESAKLSNIISEWFDKELFYLTEEPFLEYALSRINHSISPKLFDWLNKNMFDYRGLIPMGLALEAPKDMYNV